MRTVPCENCDGDGTIRVLDCHNWSTECCGGCFKDVECEECNGSGEIESCEEE